MAGISRRCKRRPRGGVGGCTGGGPGGPPVAYPGTPAKPIQAPFAPPIRQPLKPTVRSSGTKVAIGFNQPVKLTSASGITINVTPASQMEPPIFIDGQMVMGAVSTQLDLTLNTTDPEANDECAILDVGGGKTITSSDLVEVVIADNVIESLIDASYAAGGTYSGADIENNSTVVATTTTTTTTTAAPTTTTTTTAAATTTSTPTTTAAVTTTLTPGPTTSMFFP